MTERTDRKWCIIYSESNNYKMSWDLMMSLLLIISCYITPLILCFDFEERGWVITNIIIDCLFLTDMIVIFNTAITTDDFVTIDDHKTIAINYLAGWFWIDLVAIIPFQWMMPSTDTEG